NLLETAEDDLEAGVEAAEDDVDDAVLLELNSRLDNPKLGLREDILERLCGNRLPCKLELLGIKRLLIGFNKEVSIASSSKESTHKPKGIYEIGRASCRERGDI